MTKFMKWADMGTESKIIRCSIVSLIFLSAALAVLVLFMIANFLFKIYFFDYRFDDGELKPPIELEGQDLRFHINISNNLI